jgi:NAD(P)-dependent dehydrogenase (short-subunit alcohol dehydrogenase family)
MDFKEAIMRLQNTTVIITGGAGGIGRAAALRMAREGANIVIIDRNEESAGNVTDTIHEFGGTAFAASADVRDGEQIQRIVNEALERFGAVDVLVNNAGGPVDWISNGTIERTHFADASEEAWNLVLGVNLLGPMITTRAVLGNMIQRKKGKIINIASVAGVNGIVKMVDYSAAKGGIIAMTRALAIELGEYNINVNAISPGSINTLKGAPPTYLRRPGEPEEVASLILFLASDESDFITGQNYIIDGGRTLSMKC